MASAVSPVWSCIMEESNFAGFSRFPLLSNVSITVETFLPPTRVSPPGVNAERMCWEGQGQGSISEALLRLFPRHCSAPESVYANRGNQSP